MTKKQEIVKAPSQDVSSVDGFITQALGANTPIETMERLFALREKVKAEQAREAFTGAMSRFQSECPVIAKNKDVLNSDKKTVRYSYASLDSIVSQVKEFLGKNGLSYTVDVINGEGFITAVCKITHLYGHSETSSFKVPIDTEGYMSTPQKYASALTFAKRYAFCNALGILTGDDDVDASDLKTEKLASKVKEHEEKLLKCKNREEARKVWDSLPAEIKKELEGTKNLMRDKFDKEEVKKTIEGKIVEPDTKTKPEPVSTVKEPAKSQPVPLSVSNPHLAEARAKVNGKGAV